MTILLITFSAAMGCGIYFLAVRPVLASLGMVQA